ncbi:TPA: class I SAM-dependent methyltransferase [Candidatus Bathyarchaeota archaeon]|nr:class I SAM-dependent methyltransferase [Candidatus Bathyarchaeota archaeon]
MSEHYFSEKPTSPEERGLIRCTLRGLSPEFITSSGIFSHKRIDNGTRLLVESMELPEEGKLLDLGCGYGAIGVTAALLNPRLEVTMTDVNSRAVALAEENAARNGAKNVITLQGNLYEPVEATIFDIIITNPPISAGMARIVKPMITGAPTHLNIGGSLQLVVQSNKGGRTVAALIEEAFGEVEALAKGSGYRVLKGVKKD